MDRLPRRDLRSLDEFLRECYAIRNLQAFPQHILSGRVPHRRRQGCSQLASPRLVSRETRAYISGIIPFTYHGGRDSGGPGALRAALPR